MPGGSSTSAPQTSLRVAVLLGLFALAITACTTSHKKPSGTGPGTFAPLEPPPSLSTAPATNPKQADVTHASTAQTSKPANVANQGAAAQATGPLAKAKLISEHHPADPGWPRSLSANGQAFTVYQPQLDSWDGFTLEAHAAVAVESGGEQPLIFGVVSISARTLVDKEERLVTLEDVKITDARFPSAPEQAQAYGQALSDAFPRDIKSVSLDRLEAQLAIHKARVKGKAVPLENIPPRIVFMQQPSLLVYIDGEPRFVPVEGTNLARVVNTRLLLLKDPAGKLYLHVLDGYMQAAAMTGPWSVAPAPPAGATKAEAAAREFRQTDLLEAQEDPNTKKKPSLGPETAPTIIVATTPTELIVTQGQPNYVPINGTSLLYVKNTTADVFKLLTDQSSYVLLGGRWFRAKSFDGPWEFVPAKSLPKDFAHIPDSSPKENVKASISGTRQAQEALIADQIPTTARVERKTASFTPQTDGEPTLAPISGTCDRVGVDVRRHVRGVDDLRHSYQARIRQAVLAHDRLEGTAALVVTKLDPRGVKGNRTRVVGNRIDFRLGNEQELRFAVHEAPDQPRTGHPVHVHMRTRDPGHVLPPLVGRIQHDVVRSRAASRGGEELRLDGQERVFRDVHVDVRGEPVGHGKRALEPVAAGLVGDHGAPELLRVSVRTREPVLHRGPCNRGAIIGAANDAREDEARSHARALRRGGCVTVVQGGSLRGPALGPGNANSGCDHEN